MSHPYRDEHGVFFNKLGLTDSEVLHAAEHLLSLQRHAELVSGVTVLGVGGYGLEHLQAIHHHLFQDVYDWAGQQNEGLSGSD